MRKTIIVVALLIVVAGAAAYGVASNTLRREVADRVTDFEKQIGERTGFVVGAPEVSVELFPPAAVLYDGKLRERGDAGGAVAEGGTIRLIGNFADLLAGRFVPERVELDGVRFVLRPDTRRSAVVLAGALREATVPVLLENCSVQLDRGPSFPAFEADGVELRFTRADQVVHFTGAVALLGPSSHGTLDGEWRPGIGRTGGDGLELRLQVRDGEPNALGRLVPQMSVSHLRGEVKVEITADGFIGERTTESLPAEPLKGRIRAESELDLFGLLRPALFENGFALDDKRLVLEDGQGRWGQRQFAYAGWIARGFGENKVNLRMNLEDVSVADVLAEYGIAERWRPQASVTAEIRMGGSLDEPLTRYDASAESVRFDGFPGVPVSSAKVQVAGSLLAVNADVSGSFTTHRLQVGSVQLEHILIGANWWRDKLNVTTLGHRAWDGKLDAAVSYSPKESPDASGGGLLHGVDAKEALAAFFPDLNAGVEGRLDATVQGGYGAQGFWYEGRFGLKKGSIAKAPVRAVADSVVSTAGGDPTANDSLAAALPVLSSERTPLDEVVGAFSSRQVPTAFEITEVQSDGVRLRATGTLSEGRRVEAAGVATFSDPVAGALAGNAPVLAKLAAPDGSVSVPFRAQGVVTDFTIALDPGFAAVVEKARTGEAVEPFPVPAAPEPLKVDIPPLEEQFGD